MLHSYCLYCLFFSYVLHIITTLTAYFELFSTPFSLGNRFLVLQCIRCIQDVVNKNALFKLSCPHPFLTSLCLSFRSCTHNFMCIFTQLFLVYKNITSPFTAWQIWTEPSWLLQTFPRLPICTCRVLWVKKLTGESSKVKDPDEILWIGRGFIIFSSEWIKLWLKSTCNMIQNEFHFA